MVRSQGYLVLETGEVFEGCWHGGEPRAGEVVFNTSHSGYEEIATDPSYFSQIVIMTAPMQGNYGASKEFWESRKIWIEGFACLQVQDSARDRAWVEQLTNQGVPVLSEFDTRSLVLRLRSGGVSWGALVHADNPNQAKDLAKGLIEAKKNGPRDWVYEVSRKETEVIQGSGTKRIAVLDFGCKENTVRELLPYAKELALFSSRATAEEIRSWSPEYIMLSNGPGDPSDVEKATETIRELIGFCPIMGICMGHQLLALSLGGTTYKLKFGHRGGNHPIKDNILGKIYMTSQNHGYAVDQNSLPKDVQVTHVNLNDHTVAGIWSPERRCFGVQFHPESHPGPHEARELFQFFMEKL